MNAAPANATPHEPVGVVAAWGELPVAVARAMRASGHPVVCLGVRHHAEPDELRRVADHFHPIGAAQIGTAARLLRRHGVRRATLAGKFHKVDIYRPGAWWRYLPDATTAIAFYRHFVSPTGDRRDDTLLGAIVQAFAERGVTMEPATDFAPELLAAEGPIAGTPLTAGQRADVDLGWGLARAMGGLDVGQTVCVHRGAAIAIEAIEGTDRCIQRAGELCATGGFTVVKVAKPQQDMRFDVPTVGVRTLRTIAAAGGRALAIEAGQTIVLDGPEFAAEARRLRVSVVALRGANGRCAA
ncbi:MAG: UDP-2,3-diacylglucosamine diphosphatase LpxI [Planctomycetota bacterium]